MTGRQCDDRNGFAPLRVSDARPNGFAPSITIRIAVTASIIGIVFVVVWSMRVVDFQLEVAQPIGASVPSATRLPLARSLAHFSTRRRSLCATRPHSLRLCSSSPYTHSSR